MAALLQKQLYFLNLKWLVTSLSFIRGLGNCYLKCVFISSQLNAYVSDDVWIKNAKHANAMAKILSEGLNHFSNIELAYPTQSNEVFVHLPRDVIDYLNNSGYDVNEEELDGKAVRFVTAWDTKLEDIENLLRKTSSKISIIFKV